MATESRPAIEHAYVTVDQTGGDLDLRGPATRRSDDLATADRGVVDNY
jgi:hypothetical protein